MAHATFRSLTVILLAVAHWNALAATSQAGPLLDSLMGPSRGTYTPWQASIVQPAALTAPAGCNPCDPCRSQPALAYAQPALAYAQPAAAYRTSWMQVPVTYYRPVTTIDPVTGCPVTCMQPCTATVWQARRVTTWRPLCSLFNWCRQLCGSAPPAVPLAAPWAAPLAAAGCASCPTTTAVSPAPYYGPGDFSTSAPPAVTVPQGPTTAPGPTPADRPPSLSPGELEESGQAPSARRFAPSNSSNSTAAREDATRWNNQPATPPTFDPRLKPLPDPDAPQAPAPGNAAPLLLNPRDRTAAAPRPPAGLVAPIAWPQSAPPAQGSAPASGGGVWDDSGWRSLQP